MPKSRLHTIAAAGQSIWSDVINRSMLETENWPNASPKMR